MDIEKNIKDTMYQICPNKNNCCLGYELNCEMDEIMLFELVISIEEEFSIKIDDKEIIDSHFSNVSLLNDFVGRKLLEK